MGANVWSILTRDPRGMAGRIYVVNRFLLNIEAVGSWFQKIFLKFIPQ